MSTDALLAVEALRAGYGETEVLRGVDLEVGNGEIVAVLGSNGAGKSTLNAAISGILVAAAVPSASPARRSSATAPPRSSRAALSMCPKAAAFFRNLSVADNLDLGSYRRAAKRRKENRERVYAIFPRLRDRRAQRAGTLSGGERRMLAIGRGLMAEPQLIILDEPSLGLSPLLVEELFALIQKLNRDGLAILLVEQNAVQSLEISSRAYILEHGSVVMSGAAEAIRDHPGSQARLSRNVNHGRNTPVPPQQAADRDRARRL